jgi:glycosyltransferase involved in cell wall biosynthesis
MTPGSRTQAQLSVVLCSYNGAAGVKSCLEALAAQTISERLDVVVVDDGSTDETATIASSGGVRVVRHPENRGLSAARNSGIGASRASIVAFLDDDCVPDRDWAERLLAGYDDESVAGVGGAVYASSVDGVIGSYLDRHNPIRAINFRARRRFRRRLSRRHRREPQAAARQGRREMWALVGANMSFRRRHLLEVGGFDPRFRFGADEVDLAHRLHLRFPDSALVLEPEARVQHVFDATLADLLRRGRGYGRGTARMHLKWSARFPRIYPRPAAVGLLCLAASRHRLFAFAAALAPLAMFPSTVDDVLATGSGAPLLDGYIKLAQESAETVGYISGLVSYRSVRWHDDVDPAPGPESARC